MQTLYRHLINIAIQNDVTNSRNFNVGRLPEKLREYYTNKYENVNHEIITVPVTETPVTTLVLVNPV